ncbi:TPA: TatD family hydrolase [Clostridium perfringens]|uniref:TatD family hydrolase n=1 Tax=Clostridium perfringens TaxID=1502 RepID=UPI001CB077B5|nr:TatD family hydrolase [Clostridium perfringens]
MNNLIDTHFHLDYYKNHSDLYNLINTLKQYTLCVTNSPEIFESCVDIYKESKYVKFALGYNPQTISECIFYKDNFNKCLKRTKYIGEVGLDFSGSNVKTRERQIEIFNYICNAAFKNNKILSIHSRKAEVEVLNILRANKVKYAIMHWYTGPLELVDEFIKEGYYFSINPNMVNSKKGCSIISKIPKNKILIESDGPFGKVDRRKIEPKDLKRVYEIINNQLNVSNIEGIVYENFKTLLENNMSNCLIVDNKDR